LFTPSERIFEIAGSTTHSPVHFLDRERSFRPVNMLEEDQNTGDQKVLNMQPYVISTLKVSIE
jgi:hypothetical protein